MFFAKSSAFRYMFVVLVGALALACPVSAQAEGSDGPRFNVTGQATGKGDVDGGGTYSRTDTDVTAGYKWFTLSYHRADFNWSNTGKMDFAKRSGTPWETLQRLALDGKMDGRLADSIGWFAGATLISGFEDEMKDSFTLAARAGVRLDLAPEWSINLGALGMLSPVHPLFVPMVQIDWRNEADRGFSGTIGVPASTLRYRFNDMVGTRLTGYWSRDLYRLANDSSVERKGYVEESGFTTGAYMDVTPLSGLTFTAGAEVLAGRELRIYDHDGDRVSKQDVDAALGGVLRMKYAF